MDWPENVVRFPADATNSVPELVLTKPPIQQERGQTSPLRKTTGTRI